MTNKEALEIAQDTIRRIGAKSVEIERRFRGIFGDC